MKVPTGATVVVKSRQPDLQGEWKVVGPLAHSGGRNPAYDLVNVSDGRRRIVRGSYPTLVREQP